MTVKEDKKKEKEEPVDEVEELKKKLEEAESKSGEYLQMAQRLQADYDNFRKRTQRENEEFKTFATAGLDFVIGVKGIRQNLMKALESKGLTEIPTDGRFDPNCHEALCVVDGDEDGDIAEVFQRGYRLGNKVLRYSKVKVTKKKQEEEKIEGE